MSSSRIDLDQTPLDPTLEGIGVHLKVAVLDDYQGVSQEMADWSQLRQAPASVDVFRTPLTTDDEIVSALQGHDAVVLMRERTVLSRPVVERLPNLKLVVTTAMHNRVLAFDALRDAGVIVCGTEGLHVSTVEHAWALILGTARHLPEEDRNLRAGGWQATIGVALAGKVLGLVGLGQLGSRMVPIARAFGMQVIGWSPHLTPAKALDLGVSPVTKQQLFEQADIVSLHLVLGDATRGIVGEQELSWMRSTAILINSARGPLVDADALVAALSAGTIAAAGIDVFDVEPLPPDSVMRSLPRSVLTPHVGFVTDAEYRLFYEQIVEDLLAFVDGHPIRIIGG